MKAIEQDLLDAVERSFPVAKAVADYITDHPEVSGEESLSVSEYCRVLQENGFEVTKDYMGVPHFFLARSKKKNGKKAVLLAEYDALPGIGHACGHSLSGAASLLAFLALEEVLDASLYQVDLIGTPGEEASGGKIQLLEQGAFSEYEFPPWSIWKVSTAFFLRHWLALIYILRSAEKGHMLPPNQKKGSMR